MWTRFLLASALLALIGTASPALELKNVRPSFGPLGATRTDVKCLPGDVLFINYDIDGLKFDEKNGKANYTTILELIDSNNKVIFRKDTPNQTISQLGGTRMPGDLHVVMGRNQTPGKYTVRLTVDDKLAKENKSFIYPFELQPAGFGMVGVTAPAVGFPGQHYMCQYALTDMKLDKENGKPNVIVGHRILDKDGKTAVAFPVVFSFPKDLPDEVDLSKNNFHLMQFPIYLNRPGQFMIEIVAEDKNSNKRVELKYPLTVLDFTGGGK
jgi:hypothetical protein